MNFEFNKIAGAVLGTALGIMAVGIVADMIYAPPHHEKPGYVIAVAEPGAGGEVPRVRPSRRSLPIADRLQTASADQGADEVGKCKTCHTFEKGEPNKVGPNLWGVVGANVVHGDFDYSDAMRAKGAEGMTWTYENLDHFIENPKAFIPGTAMTYRRRQEARGARRHHRLSPDAFRHPVPLPPPTPAPTAEAPAAPPAAGETPPAAEPPPPRRLRRRPPPEPRARRRRLPSLPPPSLPRPRIAPAEAPRLPPGGAVHRAAAGRCRSGRAFRWRAGASGAGRGPCDRTGQSGGASSGDSGGAAPAPAQAEPPAEAASPEGAPDPDAPAEAPPAEAPAQ